MPQSETKTAIQAPHGFQLESFNLLRLDLGFNSPPGKGGMVTQFSLSFKYEFGSHTADQSRYRMLFDVIFVERGDDDTPVGRTATVQALAHYSVDGSPTAPKEERDGIARHSGINYIYGTLRGIVAGATGSFPMGSLLLPPISPQKVVEMVERDRQQASRGAIPVTEDAPKNREVALKA